MSSLTIRLVAISSLLLITSCSNLTGYQYAHVSSIIPGTGGVVGAVAKAADSIGGNADIQERSAYVQSYDGEYYDGGRARQFRATADSYKVWNP